MSDGLIPNSFTLHSSTSAQRSRGQERRGKRQEKERREDTQESDRTTEEQRHSQCYVYTLNTDTTKIISIYTKTTGDYCGVRSYEDGIIS